jgi:hypothetical protein
MIIKCWFADTYSHRSESQGSLVEHPHIPVRNVNGYPKRRVLPDKEVGMESYFYPRVPKLATSCTHWVRGCGCGYTLPLPAYPWVKYTRLKYVINEQNCTLLVKDNYTAGQGYSSRCVVKLFVRLLVQPFCMHLCADIDSMVITNCRCSEASRHGRRSSELCTLTTKWFLLGPK